MKSGVHAERSFSQIWGEDKGAYGVIGTFIVMAFFVSGYGMWYLTSSPDVKLIGMSRKRFLRGSLADEYLK
jgi:hypothetical protein